MPGRQTRTGVLTLLSGLLVMLLLAAPAGAGGLVDLADPLVGTDNSATDPGGDPGGTFPGATLPFGLVNFSPNTSSQRTNLRGGYTHSDQQIKDFTLTQFSGAGCGIYQDLPITPRTGTLNGPDVDPDTWRPRLLQDYDHRRESASPGHYGVKLNPDSGRPVQVNLSATTRTGVGRFRFAGASAGTLTFDAGGSAMGAHDARVRVNRRSRVVSGSTTSGHFCFEPSRYRLFFVARFNRPFARHGTWRGTNLRRGSKQAHEHSPSGYARAGAYVTFNTKRRRAVEVRIGVSFVSQAGARANLRESRGLDLKGTRAKAHRRWRRALDRIKVRGGTLKDRRTFASALYHSLLEPSVNSDRDGRYLGMDGRVHRLRKRTHYTDISGWDVYRSQFPLLAMLMPGRAADIAQSLVNDARQGGCLPRWPYANQNTNIMVGDPADPMIASIHALGARSFDAARALRQMVKGADRPCYSKNGDYTQREALDDYLRLGYVTHERNVDELIHSQLKRAEPWGDASTTLEYALADFTISRLAKALGREDLARRFLLRSGNWRHLVNPANGRIQPRFGTGEFAPGFDPAEKDGFVEGNSAQYNWFVPQDPAGLFETMGGREQAISRLDEFFTHLNAGQGAPYAYLGNEPSFFTPWLYNWLGRPDRTQEVVRKAVLDLFQPAPTGLPGNDDGGATSAWYVLSALGLYPAVPGTDILAVGSPLFKRTTIGLPGGKLKLSAPDAARGRPYVRGLKINGRPHSAPWIRFNRIRKGARIRWNLKGSRTNWGRGAADLPPSFGSP